MAETELTKDLLKRFGKLVTQRQTWESHWQEVSDYMMPRKADVTKRRSPGDKRSELIFDSSPLHAVELLSASLHGMLTNPATPWFSLKFKQSDLIDEDTMERLNEIIEKINEKIFVENTDENAIYDYQNFMLRDRIKSSVNLNEALKLNHVEQGKQLVNMFVGRFQPFTLGHAKVLETIHKENGFPVVVFLVKAKTKKKGDEFSRPYDEKTQIEMFNNVKKQYPFLKEIFVIPTGGIDVMFNEMRPKYEPVLWGTGSDRMTSYGYQVNNDSYRDQLNCRADFGLYEIPRTDDDISATAVRNSLLDGDEKLFNNLTPKAIHGMYNELKSKIEDSMGVVTEGFTNEIMTFEQFINKDI